LSDNGLSEQQQAALIDCINQVFSLFRINFHNQYHAAFSDTQVLNQAKRLWKEALQPFSPSQILAGARRIIEEADYLPTLHRMIRACEDTLRDRGIPDCRSAYLEAANAPSPKIAFDWSHPAVYHAGRIAGWHNLANLPESRSYPLFEQAYRGLIRRVLEGEELRVEAPPQLPHKAHRPLSREQQRQHLEALRQSLNSET